MDPRLEEACHSGNLGMLHSLLREDKLIFHRFSNGSITPSIDNPLHIAASIGHTDLANELIIRKPKLALDLNPGGLSALHLASAEGNIEIVKLLISKVGSHLSFLKDKDGTLPIHSAAMKGRIDVLEALIEVCPESAIALTYQNESILHHAIQPNSFETLEFLIKKLEVDDDRIDEILNLKDDKGNTILHHSVARRQFQGVKLLLSKGEKVEVNAMNHKGFTALDMLLDSPSQHGDLTLGEVIRAAGGKVATELDPHQSSLQTNTSRNESSNTTTNTSRIRGRPRHTYSRLQQKIKKQAKAEDNFTTGQLMVVATLIATITFQSGLNPPGGFTQDNGNTTVTNITNNSTTSTISPAGIAVLRSKLGGFLLFDMIGLFSSLIIILVLICWVPRKKKMMMKLLVLIMWVSVFSTALAFSAGIYQIFPDSNMKISNILQRGWAWILAMFVLCVYLRFIVYLLRKVGWWRNKEGDRVSYIMRKGGCLLWCMGIGVMIALLVLPFLVGLCSVLVVNSFIF